MKVGSTELVQLTRMSMYDNVGMWATCFKSDSSQNTTSSSAIAEEPDGVGVHNRPPEDAHHLIVKSSKPYEQEANKPLDKVIRRLAQNREAARKSRLRKKVYIQQLETSRVKLAQLEQEAEKVRQQPKFLQGVYSDGISGPINSGVAAFEMEYGHWIEEQNRQTCELRAALQSAASDIELRILVENVMRHYDDLFRLKAIATKSDVFYLVSGLWKTCAERFFLWIGGFRPSGLLKVVSAQLDPLTEQQLKAVCRLQQSSQQAEDALSQGLDKLQQTLSETVAVDPLGVSGMTVYMGQMGQAMGKLEALISLVDQADRLRQEALQQMYRILTTRQAARALLALGDYLHRLRALSSLWAARPCEPPA